jgi:hypothetical protein
MRPAGLEDDANRQPHSTPDLAQSARRSGEVDRGGARDGRVCGESERHRRLSPLVHSPLAFVATVAARCPRVNVAAQTELDPRHLGYRLRCRLSGDYGALATSRTAGHSQRSKAGARIASPHVSWVELFTVLAVCHMVGDYVLQTNWQALHKHGGLGSDRESRGALASHLATYTLVFVPAMIRIGDARGAGAAVASAGAIALPHLMPPDRRGSQRNPRSRRDWARPET